MGPMGYRRRYFSSSSVSTDSAMGARSTRIGPRSREYSVSRVRWLPGMALSSARWNTWMRVN